jgi:polyphosphate glucokinase
MELLGIDIGGSGIKGAPVDVDKGVLTVERFKLPTPQPSVPKAVADVVAQVARRFAWQGPIGCTFPAVIQRGVAYSAANVDKSWIGFNGEELFRKKTGCPVLLLNDADAAGIAEMEFGAGRGHTGVVILLTFGTGIGSAIFFNRQLLPNTELGHMEVRGKDAEWRASAHAKERAHLSYQKWAARINEFLGRLERLFTPDLFIMGGGISRDYDKFFQFLKTRAQVVPAQFFNQAGIVGAAMAARALVKG